MDTDRLSWSDFPARSRTKWDSIKKGIYSLPTLRGVLSAANRRYL
jgi:hypothetical protein